MREYLRDWALHMLGIKARLSYVQMKRHLDVMHKEAHEQQSRIDHLNREVCGLKFGWSSNDLQRGGMLPSAFEALDARSGRTPS